MRLKLVILALSLLATTALQAAITLPWDTPKPDTLPAYLDGSMMPYDFSACDPVPQWPDSPATRFRCVRGKAWCEISVRPKES